MRHSTYFRSATILSLCGTLFAGYLSGYKFLTASCAFNEPCPYVLGYPACWYGLALFAAMLVISVAGLRSRSAPPTLARANAFVAFVGVLFSASLTWQELSPALSGENVTYALAFPTCAYGLAFFLAIFALSVGEQMKKRGRGRAIIL